MRVLHILVLVVVCSLPRAGWALQPDKAFHQHVRQTWSIEQGLPQITVTSIVQDSTGYLWVGTQAGLARFDGVRFINYTPQTEAELPGIWIRSLHASRDGRVWVGSYKGLAVYDGKGFASVPSSDPKRWPTLDITAIAEDARGRIWVGTTNGLFQVSGQTLTLVEGSPVPVQSLLARDDGLWIGARGSTFRMLEGRWVAQPLPESAATAGVTHLTEAQGRLWAATTLGLYELLDGHWKAFPETPQLAAVPVEMLYPDSDGNLWVGSDLGIARIRNGVLTEFAIVDGPGGIPSPRAALEDREGNLWIGSQWMSLVRLSDSWTRRYSLAEGLHHRIVWSVSPDPDGRRIWVGGNDGISVLEHGRFQQVAAGSELPHPHGYNILAEADRLWIGTRRGVAVIDQRGPLAGRVRQLPILQPLAGSQIHGFVRTGDGDLWIPTAEGLYRLRGDSLRRYAQAEGLSDPRVIFFYMTREGRVLAGGQSGVFVLNGERFQRLGIEAGLAATDVTSIRQLSDGRLVIGTFLEQLYFTTEPFAEGARWHRLDAAHGMPGNVPFVLEENNGYLWAAGIRGITRVPLEDLRAFATGRITRVRGEMLLNERGDPNSGQQGYCCNGYGNGKGFMRDNVLWLPSRDGVVSMDTGDIVKNAVPPTVVIERAQWLGAWHPAHVMHDKLLPADARDLAFEFSVLSLQDPKSTQIEFILRGYDKDWQPADPLNRNTRYTNLPPGRYVFEVRGRNNARVTSTSSAQLPFAIEPRFHQTRAFQALLALLSGLLLYAGYRWQQRRHRLQRAALEALVNQRTQALELANARLEQASHTDPLTGLHNRRYIAGQIPADLAYYDRQVEQGLLDGDVLLFALVDIDHFKMVNDRFGHKAGDLVIQQFAQTLSKLVRSSDYVARWGGEEFLLVFRPMPMRNVFTLGQRIQAAVATHPFDLGNGTQVRMTCSVGLSEYPLFRNPDAQLSWESMIELADQAMYYVKANGRNGWAAFRPTPHTDLGTLIPELQNGHDQLIAEQRLQVLGVVNGKEIGGPDLPFSR